MTWTPGLDQEGGLSNTPGHMTDHSTTVRNRVLELILAASDEDLSLADLRPETSLRDQLDLTSMQAITLMMDLEDEFEITVEDEEIEHLQTVGEVLSLLETKLGGIRSGSA